MDEKIKKYPFWVLQVGLLLVATLSLQSCLSGIWTGAGLFYDRKKVMDSVSDYELALETEQALFADHELRCHFCHLEVVAFNGDLLVAGHLETDAMRLEAYRRIGTIQGFRRLYKKIAVGPIRTHLTLDSWITTKIRTAIIADSEIDPRAFKVITSDQIVYLMGDVMMDQAKWVTDIASNTSGVVRVVRLLKYYHLSDHAP